MRRTLSTIPGDVRNTSGDPCVQTFGSGPVIVAMGGPDELKGYASDSDTDLFGLSEDEKAIFCGRYTVWIDEIWYIWLQGDMSLCEDGSRTVEPTGTWVTLRGSKGPYGSKNTIPR
jgi:hypothetical protein